MESPRSNANNQLQIVISDVSNKSQEDPSVQSSESAATAAENYQLVIPAEQEQEQEQEQEREYGCRYCQKKFSNKQALGGHQNAHKVERAMEKNEQDNSIGYLGSTPSYSSYHHSRMNMNMAAPFLTPYRYRPHDFLHRSLYSWPSFPNSHQSGVGIVPYNSRPGPALYSGWGRTPTPSFQYGRPQNMNIRLPNFGAGSSSALRPGPGPGASNHAISPFPGFGIRPPAAPINLRNVPGDESDLDLSLKL
ncbi:hypothetical protein C2S51_001217 [Perilla frutescens var. frutescens]|nr:hypothetical protein C2S51_001217 [Perilla frutescens var. frutescens]